MAETVAEYVASWLPAQRGSLADTTWVNYEVAFRRHLLPEIGDRPMEEIRRRELRELLPRLQRRGLQRSSAIAVMTPLLALFRDAEEDGVVRANPAVGLGRGRRRRRSERPVDPFPLAMTAAELTRFLEGVLAHSPEDADLFFTYFGAGVRVGEALALRAMDLRPETGEIQVDETWHGRRFGLGPTKTGRTRLVFVPTILLERLAARAAHMQPEAWLFPSPRRAGQPLSKQYVGERMRRIRRLVGLADRFTPKSLRHTYATLLLPFTSMQFVQQQLGHEKIGTTVDIYGRHQRREDPEALVHLEEALARLPHPSRPHR